jgi:hypothetical protein
MAFFLVLCRNVTFFILCSSQKNSLSLSRTYAKLLILHKAIPSWTDRFVCWWSCTVNLKSRNWRMLYVVSRSSRGTVLSRSWTNPLHKIKVFWTLPGDCCFSSTFISHYISVPKAGRTTGIGDWHLAPNLMNLIFLVWPYLVSVRVCDKTVWWNKCNKRQ